MILGLSIALAACASEHGGRNDPIASADASFPSHLAGRLSSQSQIFARQHGLVFESKDGGAADILTLRNSQITIKATLRDSRVKIVAVGPVTEESINLANQYISEATAIH